jgi:PadR family transcriptional regulator, regulatory protein AphA
VPLGSAQAKLQLDYSSLEYKIPTMNPNALTVEHALLAILRPKPLHGYDIYKQITDPAGIWLVWRMKQSQLYALLAKLEKVGYITATLHAQEARPTRKVYELTNSGAQAVARWVATPVGRGRQMRMEFLLKLFFAQQDGSAAAVALLTAQREECHRWLAAHHQQATTSPSFAAHVHQFRQQQIESWLAWLNSCQTMIEATY